MADGVVVVPPSPIPAGPNMETSQLTSAAGLTVQRARTVIGDPSTTANLAAVSVLGALSADASATISGPIVDTLLQILTELRVMNYLIAQHNQPSTDDPVVLREAVAKQA